ncbi:hypothetical protein Vi05172_g11826 [Venturia inaequalis]|nr:hypothetical protein Vi05172_g11826 [Venturia inaequalis]
MVMTTKNILSAFEKTSIVPFNPGKVISKISIDFDNIPVLERPSSAKSNESTLSLSESNVSKIRAMFQVAIQEDNPRMARKLQNSMVSLQAQLAIVKAENEGLRLAVTTEKRRRKRGKPLIEDLRDKADGRAMFFSPKKIQQAKDKMEQKEREKDKAEALKEAEKEAKRAAKVEQ